MPVPEHETKRNIEILERLSDLPYTDEDLLQRSTRRLISVNPAAPYRDELRSNVLTVMYYLASNEKIPADPFRKRHFKRLCRGSLAHFLQEHNTDRSLKIVAGYDDDVRLVRFTVEELATAVKHLVPGTLPRLLEHEEKEAEMQLIELAGRYAGRPQDVLFLARKNVAELERFAGIEFIDYMRRDAGRLVELVARLVLVPGYNRDGYVLRIAIGALCYLNERTDLIADSYGVVGYLDDAFIVGHAVEMIAKNDPAAL